MRRIRHRLAAAILTVPDQQDWLQSFGLLFGYALIYLPIGLKLGFLKVEIESSWSTIIGVMLGTFFMPGLLEELLFRVLLIPHPGEIHPKMSRQFWIALSWLLFVVYHLHPFVPAFFKTPAFLIGAGLLGAACTLSYLRSGSLWPPVVIHWLAVIAWFLVWGGIEKF